MICLLAAALRATVEIDDWTNKLWNPIVKLNAALSVALSLPVTDDQYCQNLPVTWTFFTDCDGLKS
jgi:hypothetical protein